MQVLETVLSHLNAQVGSLHWLVTVRKPGGLAYKKDRLTKILERNPKRYWNPALSIKKCKCKIGLPTEHQGVHKNSFRNVCAFQDRIGISKCWFLRGENQITQRKTSWSRVENQQQTQPTYDTGFRNGVWDTLVWGQHSHNCTIPGPPKWQMRMDKIGFTP